jgi:hypothetical protein
MVKILDRSPHSKIGSRHEEQEVSAAAGVRDGLGESGASQNEYLAAENRILRAKLPLRLRLSDPERAALAEIGKRPKGKALRAVACVAKPDIILVWYRIGLVSKAHREDGTREYRLGL